MKLLVHIFLAMNNQKTLVIFAFVAALGLVAIETVDILTTQQKPKDVHSAHQDSAQA